MKINTSSKIAIIVGLLLSFSTVYAERTTPPLPEGISGYVLQSLGGGEVTWSATSSLGFGGWTFSSSTIWELFSNSATGLTYNNGTGATTLTAGYNIPLTASTTDWNNFFNASSTFAPKASPIFTGTATFANSIASNSTSTNFWTGVQFFDTNPTLGAFTEGRLYFDSTEKVLAFDSGTGETQQVGQEMWLRATNKTGSTILNGKVVYVDGSQGNRATINLAKADSYASSTVIGITTQDIADNQAGMVTIMGEVHGLNTTGFVEGDTVYLSNTTAGGYSTTTPTTGIVIEIGRITNVHATQGKILIAIGTPADTDGTLASNSNLIIPTQKAVKTYADTKVSLTGNETIAGNKTFSGTSTFATTTINGDLTMNGGIISRTVALTASTSVTINTDTTDIATIIVANATTTFQAPTGTLWNGKMFEIMLTATTTRGLGWATGTNAFASSTDLALPITIASGTCKFIQEYRSQSSRWEFSGSLCGFQN